MFSCCQQKITELDIIQNPEVCTKHKEGVIFICLNRSCEDQPLLCTSCMDDHKNHDLQSLNAYLNEDLKEAFRNGTSKNGLKVKKMCENVLEGLEKFRFKIIREINEMQRDILVEAKKLKQKYPFKNKFGIQGNSLNNYNIKEVMKIKGRQQYDQWIQPTQLLFVRLLHETQKMISNLFESLDQYLFNQPDWQTFTMETSQGLIEDFLSQYRNVFNSDDQYFRFSDSQKHTGIKLSEDFLECSFAKENPSKPTVLTKKVMTPDHPKIYFEITKSEKTMIVFESALIALGVCLSKKAKLHGYRKIIEPSNGGFLIGSNGKCYHTKLPQYQKKDLAFTFEEGEVVAVWIDYETKCVHFSKPAFWRQKEFKMELDLPEEEIAQLKPCVMFHGEVGAKVKICGENPPEKK